MHAAHPEDVGVICRLTRAAYDVSNLKATSTDEKMELTYYARDVIQKGLDLTKDVAAVNNCFYTHWVMSICASEQPSSRESGPS
ncbi:hypothetical protein PF005_g21672 [Phytophthora fragariae]|uniref:Uncharacterized protein n=1 Tax=Phytophthora fragariae TaxID=53985 RepID=A0A6A3WJ54_9STRA|nr:hypothetical protein PF003_g8604 [Phytophthora fragariae]KAE8988874.1 hypothetical protein PF011_g19001 [Phytophthora fragariae]KAE9088744.1 hypothetical protein PF010_g19269 [Phytophthora fragariae]KAE9184443.1 hypothetical protein PF005_g21672 [Phytophthora fragariae]KAE9308322.1 hypothetical protein PF008_g20997 [Phytophthora fragariae]